MENVYKIFSKYLKQEIVIVQEYFIQIDDIEDISLGLKTFSFANSLKYIFPADLK